MIKKHLKRDAFFLPLTEHMCYNKPVDKLFGKGVVIARSAGGDQGFSRVFLITS